MQRMESVDFCQAIRRGTRLRTMAGTLAALLLATGVAGAQGFRLLEATIDDVHASLNSGELTCHELVERRAAELRAAIGRAAPGRLAGDGGGVH